MVPSERNPSFRMTNRGCSAEEHPWTCCLSAQVPREPGSDPPVVGSGMELSH